MSCKAADWNMGADEDSGSLQVGRVFSNSHVTQTLVVGGSRVYTRSKATWQEYCFMCNSCQRRR